VRHFLLAVQQADFVDCVDQRGQAAVDAEDCAAVAGGCGVVAGGAEDGGGGEVGGVLGLLLLLLLARAGAGAGEAVYDFVLRV